MWVLSFFNMRFIMKKHYCPVLLPPIHSRIMNCILDYCLYPKKSHVWMISVLFYKGKTHAIILVWKWIRVINAMTHGLGRIVGINVKGVY